MRIIEENRGYPYYNTKGPRGRSGTVVMCCREENKWSHCVAVYMLLDEFKAYGPLVVVTGTPQSKCSHGVEGQHIRHQTGWHV